MSDTKKEGKDLLVNSDKLTNTDKKDKDFVVNSENADATTHVENVRFDEIKAAPSHIQTLPSETPKVVKTKEEIYQEKAKRVISGEADVVLNRDESMQLEEVEEPETSEEDDAIISGIEEGLREEFPNTKIQFNRAHFASFLAAELTDSFGEYREAKSKMKKAKTAKQKSENEMAVSSVKARFNSLLDTIAVRAAVELRKYLVGQVASLVIDENRIQKKLQNMFKNVVRGSLR